LEKSTAKKTDNYIDGVTSMKKIQSKKGGSLRTEEKQLPLIQELIDRL
jgi:hypothetical protein